MAAMVLVALLLFVPVKVSGTPDWITVPPDSAQPPSKLFTTELKRFGLGS